MAETEMFVCGAETGASELPEGIVKAHGFKFPEVHFDAGEMVRFAEVLQAEKEDAFASVPFCLTVEAEALGARINPGDARVGPRVRECAFKSVAELDAIDYGKALASGERIGLVLEAVKALSAGHDVILNVNGIFTTLASLIEMNTLYKAMRSDRETVFRVFGKLKDFSVAFTRLGLESGAKVISYADPVGDVTIMGMRMFKEFAAPATCAVIKESLALLDGRIFHLCGRMTNSLFKAGLVAVEKTAVAGAANYGDALLRLHREKGVDFVGNHCIKKTNLGQADVFALSFV
ncbi:MAG: hypothetical protein LBT74_02750 [Acidobacteriota bacterium]|jgi:uroporphyrinogen-III decarboxylase|nr:hypothetical protein [Acidobacteriota bacterium]